MSAEVPTRTDAGTRRRRGRFLAGGLAALALLAGALLAGAPAGDTEPLDPRSTAPDGLRGLIDLAEAMKGEVDIAMDVPSDISVRVLLVRDHLGDETREELRDWVRRGGQLVVSDPDSPLHDLDAVAQPLSDLVGPSRRAPDCALAALGRVDVVSHGGWIGFEGAADDDVGCFAAGDDAPWLVARAEGEGTLVALGSPAPLLNRSLDRDDNAVLAAALLFPEEGSELRVMPPSVAAAGAAAQDRDVAVEDLLPPGFAHASVLVLVAILLALLAVGRRLGQPVGERLPPTVPSAELARSVGDLLQRAGRREGAADRLRGEARLAVRGAFGADLDQETLARQAHERLGIDLAVARTALVDLEVTSDDDLVAVATAVSTVHDHLVSAA